MIVVTRLNATRFAINADLIERIQENPDTVVFMVNGAKYVVTETMEEVIALVARHRARCRLAGPAARCPGEPPSRP